MIFPWDMGGVALPGLIFVIVWEIATHEKMVDDPSKGGGMVLRRNCPSFAVN